MVGELVRSTPGYGLGVIQRSMMVNIHYMRTQAAGQAVSLLSIVFAPATQRLIALSFSRTPVKVPQKPS